METKDTYNPRELFELFLHNNMPETLPDPDEVFAKTLHVLPEGYQPSEKYQREMEKLCRRMKWHTRIEKFQNFFAKNSLRRLVIPATVLLCALVAVQANDGLLFRILFEPHETHTGIVLTEKVQGQLLASRTADAEMKVYFPKYVPDGYAIADIRVERDMVQFDLMKGEKRIWIIQTVLIDENGTKLQLDSENISLEEIEVNQTKAFYKEKDGTATLYFFNNQNYFRIKGDGLSKKEIIRIAESFEMILS